MKISKAACKSIGIPLDLVREYIGTQDQFLVVHDFMDTMFEDSPTMTDNLDKVEAYAWIIESRIDEAVAILSEKPA